MSKTRPYVFNCTNALVLFGLGDAIQQNLNINYLLQNVKAKITQKKELSQQGDSQHSENETAPNKGSKKTEFDWF